MVLDLHPGKILLHTEKIIAALILNEKFLWNRRLTSYLPHTTPHNNESAMKYL